MDCPYNYTLDVVYENDKQYRDCIRQVFKMNFHTYDQCLDDITNDENDYDEENAKIAMDFLYEKTKQHPLFRQVFQKAAGFMFSLDETIGLAVLCSYDYLALFHPCLQTFLSNENRFHENCQEWKSLIHILS